MSPIWIIYAAEIDTPRSVGSGQEKLSLPFHLFKDQSLRYQKYIQSKDHRAHAEFWGSMFFKIGVSFHWLYL